MKYHLYRVEWEDAASDNGWAKIGEEDPKPVFVSTVGWLIRETKSCLFFAQNMTNFQQSGNRIQIPKAWIKKKTFLKGHPIVYDT